MILTFYSPDRQAFVFDATGRFVKTLRHPSAHSASGPSEVGFLTVFRDPFDSVHVIDDLTHHAVVFGPNLLQVNAYELRVSGAIREAVRLTDGSFLVNAIAQTPELVGLPLHALSSEHKAVRSFGSDDGSFRLDQSDLMLRRLSPTPSNALWTARLREYVLERWTVTGDLERRLERRPDWFSYWSRANTDLARTRSSYIAALREDSRGRLWVVSHVATPQSAAVWRDLERQLFNMNRQGRAGRSVRQAAEVPIRSAADLFSARVELVDPRSGSLVRSAVAPALVMRLLADTLALSVMQDGAGNWIIDLWRIAFDEPDGLQRPMRRKRPREP